MAAPAAAALTPLAWLALCAYPALYVSVLLHEAGHAAAGALSGYGVTSFGMGLGRPLLVLRLPRGTRFYLCARQPFQGLTWALRPDLFAPRRQGVALVLGGPLVNLLLGLAAFALYRNASPAAAPLWATAAGVNALLFVTTLFPFQASLGGGGVLRSDGAQALALLRRSGVYRPAQAPATLLALRPLWEAVGDVAMHRLQLLAAAAACLEADAPDLARGYLAEARALPRPDPLLAYPSHYEGYVEGVLLAELGDAGRAVAALEAAEAGLAGQGHAAAAYLARLGRLQCDRAGAAAIRAASDPTLEASFPVLATLRHSLETAALARAHAAPADLDAALARYEAARRAHRYDAADRETYAAVAAFRDASGDFGGAGVAYEQAVAAAKRTYDALAPDPALQDRFGDTCQPLVGAAAECLARLGRAADAERLRAAVPDAAAGAARRAQEREQAEARQRAADERHARRFRRGAALTLINGAVALVAYMILRNTSPGRGAVLPVVFSVGLGMPAALGLALAVLAGAQHLLFRRRASLRTDPAVGLLLLAFAAMGYVLTAALAALLLLVAPPPR